MLSSEIYASVARRTRSTPPVPLSFTATELLNENRICHAIEFIHSHSKHNSPAPPLPRPPIRFSCVLLLPRFPTTPRYPPRCCSNSRLRQPTFASLDLLGGAGRHPLFHCSRHTHMSYSNRKYSRSRQRDTTRQYNLI